MFLLKYPVWKHNRNFKGNFEANLDAQNIPTTVIREGSYFSQPLRVAFILPVLVYISQYCSCFSLMDHTSFLLYAFTINLRFSYSIYSLIYVNLYIYNKSVFVGICAPKHIIFKQDFPKGKIHWNDGSNIYCFLLANNYTANLIQPI